MCSTAHGCCSRLKLVYRQDYLKRQVELFAQALASIIAKRKLGRCDEALAEVQQARAQLGVEDGFLDLDGRSLVSLIGNDRAACLADLLEEEALVREQLGDETGATRARNRRHGLR